jgi:hypothetical protein
MCFDPVSIALMVASTAATAGGNRLNQLAANKAIKGQVGLERIRQQKFQADSDQNFRNALEDFNPQNMQDNLAKTTTGRDSAISGNLADPSGGYEAANNNQPEVVKSSIAKSLSDAVAKSKGQAKRLAALGSTGEVFGNKAIDLGRSASKGAMIGNFAQGSSNVSKAEQAAAAQKTSGWGDALGLAGQGLSMYNMISAPSRAGGSIFDGLFSDAAGSSGGAISANVGANSSGSIASKFVKPTQFMGVV